MDESTMKSGGAAKDSANPKKAAKTKAHGVGRPRQDDVEDRLENLMNTALKLFLEHGYGNVSLETIAKAAHVAVRTIYVKFGGKIGLLSAAITMNREQAFAGLLNMEDDDRPLPEVLLDFGKRFLGIVMTERAGHLQRIVFAEAKRSPDMATAFYNAGPIQTRQMLTRYFAREDVRAQLREDLSVDTLTGHFLGCLSGDIFVRLVMVVRDMSNQEIRERAELAVSLFLSGARRQ
ncbi:TetR/AcrR family transcriptional regulator [Undibacterium sp. TJN25]|uniref:TetR/AcrR family transcriptional regulator n=1 Tax=Undibacterium sp. TJN25 TaxID=3413056 RepID=UPI003BF03C81